MRIVFASLGSLGDLHPILALAGASRERSHTPVIAASETYRQYVLSLGFIFCAIRPDFEPDPVVLERLFDPRKGPERMLREEIFPRVRETYLDLVEAGRGADFLVVGELLYVAPLVADKLGIPWANVILAPTSFLSASDPCILAPAPSLHRLRHLGQWPHRLIFALGRMVTRKWGRPLQDFRKELGYDAGPSAVFDGKHSPLLVLGLFPEFFARMQTDWPPQTVQIGFPFFTQPARPETAKKVQDFLAEGEPPAVFTLGSTVVHFVSDFYFWAAKAVEHLGRRAILLMGRNPLPENLPANILAIDYIPLESVLPHAAAVIHQGGVGTCAEALRAGVPSLVIPFGFDQPDNGERLRRLGVGRVLPRNRLTGESLLTNLRDLLADQAMAQRARVLASQVHPAPDLEKSIDEIERVGRAHGRHSAAPAALLAGVGI